MNVLNRIGIDVLDLDTPEGGGNGYTASDARVFIVIYPGSPDYDWGLRFIFFQTYYTV